MVRELEQIRHKGGLNGNSTLHQDSIPSLSQFPVTAPAANPVFTERIADDRKTDANPGETSSSEPLKGWLSWGN